MALYLHYPKEYPLYTSSHTLFRTAVTAIVFVFLYPFLWSNPVGRTQMMLEYRLPQMEGQLQALPQFAIDGPAERVTLLPTRILETYAAFSWEGALVLNVFLLLAGALVVIRLFRCSFLIGELEPAITTIGVVGIVLIAPTLLTPFDWDRYYLLPEFFSTMIIALGIGGLAQEVSKLIKNVYMRQKSDLRTSI